MRLPAWRTHDLHDRDLWPLIDPALADPDLAAVAAAVLDAARGELRPLDLDDQPARDFVIEHRLAGLIPIEAVADRHRRWLERRQVESVAVQLRLRSAAIDVLDLLHDAGFETRVLKGLATAELDYADPTLRHTGDVDIAVRLGDLDPVRELLAERRYRDHPTPFSPYLLYGWTFDAPGGTELDLHTRLFRRSPLADDIFTTAGEPLSTLPGTALTAPHRLVHAAGHFLISPPGTRRMSSLVDVTRLLERPDLDLDAARSFAATLGVESLVGAGIRVEAELSGRTDIVRRLDSWRAPDWVERNTRLIPRRRLVLDHLVRYREVPPGHRLGYLPTWLLPNRRQRTLLVQSGRRAIDRVVERLPLPGAQPHSGHSRNHESATGDIE